MPSASYHINRKAKQKRSRYQLKLDNAKLIGLLGQAWQILNRPSLVGRLKWAVLHK